MRLQGKVAFVSGAGSGLGRAMARAFAAEGAVVAVNDLRAGSAEAVRDELPGEGHLALPGDIADSDRVRQMFQEIDRELGRLDVLVNNAGVDKTPGDGWEAALAGEEQLLHMSDDGWRRMLAIHLDGAFFTIRAGLPLMLGNGGSIVNISSIAGLAGMGQPHYATAKGGLLGLTRALARTLGPRGIRVNAICPGAIDTPMTQGVPEPMIEALRSATPLRRVGRPEEIAAAAVFLASDDSSFVTGQWISPNGGLHIA